MQSPKHFKVNIDASPVNPVEVPNLDDPRVHEKLRKYPLKEFEGA